MAIRMLGTPEEETQPVEASSFRLLDGGEATTQSSYTPLGGGSFRQLGNPEVDAFEQANPPSKYDTLSGAQKFGTNAMRLHYNLRKGLGNILGTLPDTVIMGLHESGIIEDETAADWRAWGKRANELFSGGLEGYILDQSIKNISNAPDGMSLDTVMEESGRWWNTAIPQGLGSLAGFALASRLLGPQFAAAGMNPTLARFAAPALLGSIVNSNELYHDAMEHGATGSQRGIAWGMGMATGWLEAVSVGRMLGRMDNAAAKAFTDLVTKKNMEPWRAFSATQSFTSGIKGAIEEGLQEWAQTVIGNLTANTVAGYDPTRGYFENSWEAGGTGATVGFLGAAMLTAFGIKRSHMKALKHQEWRVREDGMAVPPEGSAWEIDGIGYRQGDVTVTPYTDQDGTTRWQVMDTSKNKNEEGVEVEGDGGDLGSYLKPETATTIGQRWITNGHLGFDPTRQDFFGEFNAITEVMQDLYKKKQELLQEETRLLQKFDGNQLFTEQLIKLGERARAYAEGDLTPLNLVSDHVLPFHVEQQKNQDVASGFVFASNAPAQRQIIDPITNTRDGADQDRTYISNTMVFPTSFGKLSEATPTLGKVLDLANTAADKATGAVSPVYAIDPSTAGEVLNSKESIAFYNNLIKNVINPMVTKWAAVMKLQHANTIIEDGVPKKVFENKRLIVRMDPTSSGGFIAQSFADNVMTMNLGIRGLEAIRELKAMRIKRIEEAQANKQLTEKEAKQLIKETRDDYKQRENERLSSFIDTVSHELGHAITLNQTNDLLLKFNARMEIESGNAVHYSPEYQAQLQANMATDNEVKELKLLYLGYMEFLQETNARNDLRAIAFGDSVSEIAGTFANGQLIPMMGGKPIKDFRDAYQAVAEGRGDVNAQWDAVFRSYFNGFQEYLANQFARYMSGQPLTPSELRSTKFIKDGIKYNKQLAEAINEAAAGTLGAKPYPSMKLYFDLKQVNRSIEVQGALEGLNTKTLADVLKGDVEGMDPDVMEMFNSGVDSFSKAHDMMLNLVQIAQLNPHIAPLQTYMDHVMGWSRSIGQTIAQAEATHKLARKLGLTGKEKGAHFGKVVFHESTTGKELTLQEKSALIGTEWTSDMETLYQSVKANYRGILERMRQVTLEDAEQNFGLDPAKLAQETARINKEFDDLANKPYFPFMRFGKWTVTVKAKSEFLDTDGTSYKPGQIISFESFDTRVGRELAHRKLTAKYGRNHHVGKGKMSDTRGSLQAMPVSFLRAVRKKLETRLPPDVKKELDEIIQEYSPGESFKQAHFKRRKGTRGYSQDWQRSHAAYMRQAAGHIARMEFQPKMTAALAEMQTDSKTLNQTADGTKRTMITDWMNDHMNYILNPSIEWAGLRGFMFQWFLGFNLKSAVVNMTQIPLVTYPFLAARYGDLDASMALARSQKDAILYFNRPNKVSGTPSMKLGKAKMLDELLDRQILEQSLATELALAASSDHLERYTAGGAKQAWYKVSEWGAMPFHTAERINRMSTALAAYELAREKGGLGHGAAVNAAHDAVLKTQYDYSKWNRPKFMRGRKGVIFLFMNYVQNTLFFGMGGDPGAMRHQLMLFLLAGWMGMPFMEDFMTVLDFILTKFKDKFGMKDPKTDLRVQLREFVREVGMNPDLFMNGLAADSLGLATLGRAAGLGAWVPQFDIGASVSMGRIIPGVDMLKEHGNFEQGFVRGLERTGGAFASSVVGVMRAQASNDPNTWKQTEKMMPAFARNLSKAARLATEGQEKTRSGEVIAEYDPQNPKEAMELIALGFGFQPRQSTQGWQEYIHQKEAVRYYAQRRDMIRLQFNYAQYHGDREAIADMRAAVRKYNSQVPFPEMKLTGQDIASSYQAYVMSQKKSGAGVPDSLRDYRLEKRVREAYGRPSREDN
jgi:hypothetical protein